MQRGPLQKSEVTSSLNTYDAKLNVFKDFLLNKPYFYQEKTYWKILEYALSATALVPRGCFVATTGTAR